jgi:hypothetical protein
MEPEIEFLSRNFISNNIYSDTVKSDYFILMNRIIMNDTVLKQMRRSMDYNLLFNTLNEEIIYLSKRLEYFNKYIQNDIKELFNEYINYYIQEYNKMIHDL